MDVVVYAFGDVGNSGWLSIATSASGPLMAGTVLLAIKRMLARHDLEQHKRDVEQAKRDTALNVRLDTISLRIETVHERSLSKDETLGYEIADTREQLAWYSGQKGLDRPSFPKRSL